jgi:hypothetical protein
MTSREMKVVTMDAHGVLALAFDHRFDGTAVEMVAYRSSDGSSSAGDASGAHGKVSRDLN